MPPAVKFLSETDTSWVYEGLAIPYGGPLYGRDLTGSYFTKSTDLCLDWFPNEGRPLLYRHGFDDSGPSTSPVGIQGAAVREDDKGRWYQLQIDKAKAYASEVKQLLDDGLLLLSSGAVDHLTKVAAKTGEIQRWPWVELSLVPNAANPEALPYPVKSLDAMHHVLAVGLPVPEELRIEATKGWLPEGTTQGDLDDGDFAWIASDSSLPDSERRKLPYKVHGEVSELGWRAAWTRAHQDATDFSGGPSRSAVLRKLLKDKPADVNVSEQAPAGKDASAAYDAASGAGILQTLLCLIGAESTESDQLAMLTRAMDAVIEFIQSEVGEVDESPPADTTVASDAMVGPYGGVETPAYLSLPEAIKEGRRNSASDMTNIQAIHDASASLGAACPPGAGKATDTPPANVLAVKAGDDAAPGIAEADLAAFKQLLTGVAVATAQDLLRSNHP